MNLVGGGRTPGRDEFVDFRPCKLPRKWGSRNRPPRGSIECKKNDAMEKHVITQLKQPIHRNLCRERVLLHRAMRRIGIIIEKNKPMRYGFVIKFYYQGEACWLMVYKNRKNRTNFCFSFVSSEEAVNYLRDNLNFDEIAQGPWKPTVPDECQRIKIKWWRENVMKYRWLL